MQFLRDELTYFGSLMAVSKDAYLGPSYLCICPSVRPSVLPTDIMSEGINSYPAAGNYGDLPHYQEDSNFFL